MPERYTFLRYYLPGSLFITYMLILIIPNLAQQPEDLVVAIVGAFGASPVVGYLIYALYNNHYEEKAKDTNRRGALRYLSELRFVKEDGERKDYKALLESDKQKKEFLDLVFWSNCKAAKNEADIDINPEIVQVLKNHLSSYAARTVCGIYVPLVSVIGFGVVQILGIVSQSPDGPIFAWKPLFVFLWFAMLVLVSLPLLYDRDRVLDEAFQLEENFVKAKKKEILLLLERLGNANTIED